MSRAFSLIEILVTIAVLAVLAALAFPLLSSSLHRSDLLACSNNLRGIGVAFQAYALDNGNRFPATYDVATNTAPWQKDLWPYLHQEPYPSSSAEQKKYVDCSYVCPAAYRAGEFDVVRSNGKTKGFLAGSYGINREMPSQDGTQITAGIPPRIHNPGKMCLMMDNNNTIAGSSPRWEATVEPIRNRHQEKLNVLFADGHVETRQWQEVPSNTRTPEGRVFWWGHYGVTKNSPR